MTEPQKINQLTLLRLPSLSLCEDPPIKVWIGLPNQSKKRNSAPEFEREKMNR